MFSLFSALLLLSFLFTTLAAPTQLQTRAVSQSVYDQLSLFEQYAAAAYCKDNNDSPDTKLTCSAGNCPEVEAADTETLTEFQNSLITDVTGYVAVDHTNSLVIVGFRGSKSVRNFITDADFPLVPVDLCSGCKADDGFWNSWLEARDGVMKAITSADDAYADYKLVLTGHSLGAAIATLAAAQLRNEGHSTALYTYGSPRVGNPALAAYVTSQQNSAGNFRVTHTADPVPRLPPTAFGFSHTSPEFFISSGNNVPVTANDITEFDGTDETQGNAGQAVGSLDVSDHSWYFNEVGGCAPEDFEFKSR